MSDLTFEPPGPGTWQLDAEHYPRPASRYKQELLNTAMDAGVTAGASRYGVLVDRKTEIVNGYPYATQQPVEGATDLETASASEDPERSEYHRRVAAAAEAFETKLWRAELDRWDAEWKPEIRTTQQSLREVQLGELDDAQLVDHIETCREAFIELGKLNFRIFFAYLVPLGDFLAFARDQTDRSAAELVALMDGATPESTGALDELHHLTTAVESDSVAQELLFSEEPASDILAGLRTHGGVVEDAIEAWLDEVGYRVVSGFDLSDEYALERPETLVNTLRTAVEDGVESGSADGMPAELEAVRRDVPSDQRAEFDERFEEARHTYRIRDERALLTLTTQGVLRRALLEAGRRLANRGRLRDPEHVVDLEHDELVSAVRGGPAPGAAEVAAHVHYRQHHDASEAPDRLGPKPSNPIPIDDLPDPAARVMRAVAAFGWMNNTESESSSGADRIQGIAASPGTFEGPARLVSGPEDFPAIQDGEVLVAETTTPAFNVVLPMVGAVVTDQGGMLSHPAIVSREFGIPSVVGCENATDRIQDGDRLLVDGEEGAVRFPD